MAKYRCMMCGEIYDEEKEKIKIDCLDNDWVCKSCYGSKDLFELIDDCNDIKKHNEENPYPNAIHIKNENLCIEKLDGCINCGMCTITCMEREKMVNDPKKIICVGCGQCIMTCPMKILRPKSVIKSFLEAKEQGKKCIAYISPGSRVSIGDLFGYEYGSFLEEELVGILKKIGFDLVFDVAFGADLTIMEEASELIDRIKNNGVLPMITSCCPAWVSIAEMTYPYVLKNISTTKSPIGMMGAMVKNYYCQTKNINKEDIFTVAITPCTAKKQEIKRDSNGDTDLVLTISELCNYLKQEKIDIKNVNKEKFDSLLGESSGAGLIFGATGGVLEAALRTANYLLTNENLEKIEFKEVRGYNGIKEAKIKLGNIELSVAAIDEMANAIPVLQSIKNNNCKYDFIEIMNCRGGCIGGGGQPECDQYTEETIKKSRMESLYTHEKMRKYRTSHENTEIKKAYDLYLERPLSNKSKKILHTSYEDRSSLLK